MIDYGFPFAIDEVELVLHRHDLEKPLRPLNLVDADFRQPDLPNLALPRRLLQNPDSIALRSVGVDSVPLGALYRTGSRGPPASLPPPPVAVVSPKPRCRTTRPSAGT